MSTSNSSRRRQSFAALGVLTGLALTSTACGGGIASNNNDSKSSGPITLGMATPLSGSSSATGPNMKNGAQLAINEINAKGGVLGRKLQLNAQDSACDAKTAVAAANKLVSSKVAVSVGGYCSGATLPTLNVFNRANIPMVIPAANSSELVDQKLPNVFLINGTGKQQSAAAERWITQLGSKRVAMMNDSTSYSKDIADKTAALVKAPGGANLARNESVTAGEQDYSANVTAVLRTKPDLVYWTGYYQEGGLIIRQLRQSGYKGKIMVGDGSVDAKLISIAGKKSAEGVYATMTQTPETIPNGQKWIADYKKAFGSAPGPYSTQSYDAVRVAAEAIKNANSTDGKKIDKALEGLKDFQLFSGPLTFSPDHTLAKGGFLILVVKNGDFAVASRLQ